MNKMELLVPAGNLEKLKIATLYGADAIYCGLDMFSLRAGADNFTIDELKDGVAFAHTHGTKVYVAFNVYPKDEFKEKIVEYLTKLDEIKIDAIIVSSIYILELCEKYNFKFARHISTQESVSNSAAIEVYKQLGASRVVMARELHLSELEIVSQKSDLELETFIHGSMCCSISGRCNLSDNFTGYEANLGACLHPCRWKYTLYKDGKPIPHDFFLGSKDLQTIKHIKDLANIGIASLKIEGRMKSNYYVATVTSVYRQLIDDIYSNNLKDYSYYLSMLEEGRHGSLTEGFLNGDTNHNDLIYQYSYPPSKSYLGMILEYDNKTKLAYVDTKNPISLGDTIYLMSPKKAVKSFVVNRLLNPDKEEVQVATNTTFNYYIEIPYDVSKYDILTKK